jgi:hypothetical protein
MCVRVMYMCVRVMYMCVRVMYMCVRVMHMCVRVMYMCVRVIYMCVRGIDFDSVSMIFQLTVRIVLTVLVFFCFSFYTYSCYIMEIYF